MDPMLALAPDERLDRINENLTLIQKKNGLTFGTDAFLLAAFVRSQRRAVAVDLGSGVLSRSILAAVRASFLCFCARGIKLPWHTRSKFSRPLPL